MGGRGVHSTGFARAGGAPAKGRKTGPGCDRPEHPNVEKGLAGKVAKNGKEWDENLPGVQRAYNATPHSTTIVAPEDVELEPSALFRSFQRNADNFIVNRAQSERRMGEIRETNTIRAPLPTQGRSFGRSMGTRLM